MQVLFNNLMMKNWTNVSKKKSNANSSRSNDKEIIRRYEEGKSINEQTKETRETNEVIFVDEEFKNNNNFECAIWCRAKKIPPTDKRLILFSDNHEGTIM